MAHEVRANTPFPSRFRGGREFVANEWTPLTDAEWDGELGDAIRGDAMFEHREVNVKPTRKNPASLDTPPAPNAQEVNLTPVNPDPGKSKEALPK